MPFSDPHGHLEDVLDAIDKIDAFIGEMDLNAYRTDEKTKAAVERKIESPGAYPEIDQKGYRGMGNILRHSYHRVDDRIVWNTVKEDLPELRSIVKKRLLVLRKEQSEQTQDEE